MRPIGREVGGGIAQRGRSLISTIALFNVMKRICTYKQFSQLLITIDVYVGYSLLHFDCIENKLNFLWNVYYNSWIMRVEFASKFKFNVKTRNLDF